MPKKTKRGKLVLTDSQKQILERAVDSGKEWEMLSRRALVLLLYARNIPINRIHKTTLVSRPTIYKYIDKALRLGPEKVLFDYLSPGSVQLRRPESDTFEEERIPI